MDKGFICTKLRRYYGFTESTNSMLFVESILKIGIRPVLLVGRLAFLRVSGKPSNSEYLLILNLFNAFLKSGNIQCTLLNFRIPKLRKPANSLVQLFEVFGRVNLNGFRLMNFMYMLLAVYVPQIFGALDHSTSFTTSVIFPDFSVCPGKLDNYTRLYPQYGTLLKKAGFSRLLPPLSLLVIIPFSSYTLKYLYASSIFEDDWVTQVEFYWLSDQNQVATLMPLLYSFFKLCNF